MLVLCLPFKCIMDPSRQDEIISEEQFEQLFLDHYEYLCQKTYAFTNDPNAAKDIVQDVFLRIWRQRAHISPGGNFKSYLHRSCINQALNYIKSYKRKTERETRYLEERTKENTDPEAENQLIADEVSDQINRCINDLSPACREAFLLSRYEQMSYKEIAAKLNISVNTVEKHVGKALKSLRLALKQK